MQYRTREGECGSWGIFIGTNVNGSPKHAWIAVHDGRRLVWSRIVSRIDGGRPGLDVIVITEQVDQQWVDRSVAVGSGRIGTGSCIGRTVGGKDVVIKYRRSST